MDTEESDDQELAAMAALSGALAPLPPAVRGRVLSWAVARFGSEMAPTANPGRAAQSLPTTDTEFADLASIFHAASPASNGDKALVAGYWLQESEGHKDLDAQRVNTELKQLGHGIANITSAFSELMTSKPKFAIQIRKAGSSRQARKRYRITVEGAKRVHELIAGTAE